MKKILSIILVVMIVLSATIFAYADDTEKTVKISAPEMITYAEKANYGDFTEFEVVVYDWTQYSEISVIVNYNNDLFTEVYKQYPAIAGVNPPAVHDSADNGKRVCRLNPPEVAEYYDVKDFSFDILFDVVGTGQHNITFDVQAYDLDGNKVDVDLQIDKEIYPEIIHAETAGVYVLDALELKSGYAYEDCGVTVQDIYDKVKADNFRIKNQNGTELGSADKIPNGSFIEIIYDGYIAYTKTLCVSFDVDCDGEITAADARLALRNSAQLEFLDSIAYSAADVDGKSWITAADARLILRKAAQID